MSRENGRTFEQLLQEEYTEEGRRELRASTRALIDGITKKDSRELGKHLDVLAKQGDGASLARPAQDYVVAELRQHIRACGGEVKVVVSMGDEWWTI